MSFILQTLYSSLVSLRDMTTQRYPSHEGNESSNSDIYPLKNGSNLKNEFLCPESFSPSQN